MVEEALVDHIFVRLEPQVQDYVEVRNPQKTVQLLEVLPKFEERYSCKALRGSGNSDNFERRGWSERRMSNADDSRRNWRNSEVVRRPSNGRNDYRVNYENGRQRNQWFDSKKRFQKNDPRFNDRGYQFINGGQKDDFSRGDSRNRGSSKNFSRGDTREFEKPWMFHVLADLEYPCILGVDFISGSNIILNFDRKSLEIPDSQIDKVIITIEERNVEIDLSKTGLEERHK
ncbi:uncharacterized protein TNCV_3261511 [Trichonephila clavipes]|nr:uncharacterized protein TNCV_3261511 [Trichonephila clavipes]